MQQEIDHRLIDSFYNYVPFNTDNVIRFEQRGPWELCAHLNDGSMICYYDYDKTSRAFPTDTYNMTDEQLKKYFGRRLRRICFEKNITQEELSNRTGIPRSQISNYFTGKTEPSAFRLRKIARALECPLEDLML